MSEPLAEITLNVNGAPMVARADPDTPLLYVLRRDLGLTGTRFGCGEGMCGACTVLLDGRAVQSCDIPVGSVGERTIETIEAQADHPLVRAIVAAQAGQCGYCLPGIVMAAKALLADDPTPDRERIAAALDGNLCRCGAHLRILRAIESASADMAGATP